MRNWDCFRRKSRKRSINQKSDAEQMTHPGERSASCDRWMSRKKSFSPPLHRRPGLRLFQYTAIDEFTAALSGGVSGAIHLFLGGLPAQAAGEVRPQRHTSGVSQTDNGFEFTNRFPNSKRDLPRCLRKTAAELGIRHKLIRPYTPRHNGRSSAATVRIRNGSIPAIRSIRCRDFEKQLAPHNRRANNAARTPTLAFSPIRFAVQYV